MSYGEISFVSIECQLLVEWRLCLLLAYILQIVVFCLRHYKLLTHSLLSHGIMWNIFMYQSEVNSLSNDDFAYFVYSHKNGGITGKHWLTNIASLVIYRIITM